MNLLIIIIFSAFLFNKYVEVKAYFMWPTVLFRAPRRF